MYDNKHPTSSPISIYMPNGQMLQPTHTALLKNKSLPPEAHLFPGLNKALLSIRILCDHGCLDISNSIKVIIINKKYGKTLMRGGHDSRSYLYTLTLYALNLRAEKKSPEKSSATNVHECKSKVQLIDDHHVSCWSPVKTTWAKAV